jgi:hypothetical protein
LVEGWSHFAGIKRGRVARGRRRSATVLLFNNHHRPWVCRVIPINCYNYIIKTTHDPLVFH